MNPEKSTIPPGTFASGIDEDVEYTVTFRDGMDETGTTSPLACETRFTSKRNSYDEH